MWKGVQSTICCPYSLPSTRAITGQVTGYIHNIQDPVDCETPNCVYYWKCVKDNCKKFPKCEYIGLTSRPYKKRIAEQKQYVKSKDLDKNIRLGTMYLTWLDWSWSELRVMILLP